MQNAMFGSNDVTTADYLAKIPPKPRDPSMLENWASGIAGMIAQGIVSEADVLQKFGNDPLQAATDAGEAAAAGAVSIGSPLYGDQTNEDLAASMAKMPKVGAASSLMAPLPVVGAANAMFRSPKAVGGLAGGLAASQGATAADDEGGNTYEKRKLEYETQRAEAFQALEQMRADEAGLSAKLDAEFNAMDPRALQRMVGAEPDGAIGGKTRAKIEAYKQRKLDQMKAENKQAATRLQARYDALGGSIEDLDKEYSPEAVRQRQSSSRIAELYPDATAMAQGGLMATGIALDMASKGRARGAFNNAMFKANKGAEEATAEASKALGKGRLEEAAAQSTKASAYSDQAAGLRETGSMVPWNSVAGFEAASFGPDVVDYFRASNTGNDELKDKVLDQVVGDDEERNFMFEPLAKRLAVTGGAGLMFGKLGKGLVDVSRQKLPPTDVLPERATLQARAQGDTAATAAQLGKGMAEGRRADVLFAQNAAKADQRVKLAPGQAKAAVAGPLPQKALPAPEQPRNLSDGPGPLNPPAQRNVATPQITPEVEQRAQRLMMYDTQVLGRQPRPMNEYVQEALADPGAMKNMRFKGELPAVAAAAAAGGGALTMADPAAAGPGPGSMGEAAPGDAWLNQWLQQYGDGGAFDGALNEYGQTLIDVDGDGIPDVAVPAQGGQ